MDYLVSLVAFALKTPPQSVSVIQSYFLAVCKYPEVQAKAQAELDAVIGRERLPTPADRDSLPYIGAICKELDRWLVSTSARAKVVMLTLAAGSRWRP